MATNERKCIRCHGSMAWENLAETVCRDCRIERGLSILRERMEEDIDQDPPDSA